MEKLNLLFTKDGLQYQVCKNKTVVEESSFLQTEEENPIDISEHLSTILSTKKYREIQVISAINHFTLMPESFSDHELGYDLIGFNASLEKENEELMLSVNKKFGDRYLFRH